MKNQPVVRIVTHPFFARYENELKGFYREPTTPDVDMLFLAIDLKYFETNLKKAKAIVRILDNYSLFCDRIHLFVQRSSHEYSSGNQDFTKNRLKELVVELQAFPRSFSPITVHILPADSWSSPGVHTRFEDEYSILLNVLLNGSLKLETKVDAIPEDLDDKMSYVLEFPSDEDTIVSFPTFNIHHIP